MKKKIFILLYIVLFSLFATNSVNALVLEGATDTFTLTDNKFEKDEAFVYSATLNFRDGQAGGLAFGALEDTRYYVFNVDRFENKVKLLYFAKNEQDRYDVKELFTEYYIGHDKMTDGERAVVFPKVREMPNVDLKVVITPEDDKVYAEFYADGIKRFGIDNVIDLNNVEGFDVDYQGGYLGYNVFNANIEFTNEEIGSSDYAYYTEMYRQQYHFHHLQGGEHPVAQHQHQLARRTLLRYAHRAHRGECPPASPGEEVAYGEGSEAGEQKLMN